MSFDLYPYKIRLKLFQDFCSSIFPKISVLRIPAKGFAPLSLILLSLTAAVLYIFTVVFSNPLSASKSEIKANGFYSLTSPIMISAAPKVIITEGKLRLFAGSVTKNKAALFGGLPFNWTDSFIAKKLTHIQLTEAKISIDFRGVNGAIDKKLEPQDTSQLLHSALEASELEHIQISNSAVTVFRDFTKPLHLTLNQSQFDVDLGDHEIEGAGKLKLKDKVTAFSINHDFSLKNKKGIVLNKINLSLKNDDFISNFDGVLEGRAGLHLKGKAAVEITDINLSKSSLIPSQASETIRFMASGDFIWSDNKGTLSDGQFKFGRNRANGSLSLKLSQANPEIAGTLAFKTLDFSEFHTLKRRTQKFLKPKEKSSEDHSLINSINLITPLIRNYDADIRLSADQIKLQDWLIDDAGFSLFQKNGELLIDMAGLGLLGGTATGLVKIDTSSPKPRWHINSGFKNIDLSELKSVLPSHSFFNGIGHLKLKLTSFGDKGVEIYENMSGSLNFTLPKGGKIALDLNQFIGEQEKNSEQTLKNLKTGESSFQFLNSFAHFAKGSVIFDHFMLSTKKYDFTGHGFLNLKSQALNWHIASWETTKITGNSELLDGSQDEKAYPPSSENDGRDGKKTNNKDKIVDHLIKTPILLTCSHVKGFWDALSFEKYTALHLSLLNRACPAFYHYDQLKTKDHPIVHSDNAR